MDERDEIERRCRELARLAGAGPAQSRSSRGVLSRDQRSVQELMEELIKLTSAVPPAESGVLDTKTPANAGEHEHHSVERAAAHLRAPIAVPPTASGAGAQERPDASVAQEVHEQRNRRRIRLSPYWVIRSAFVVILLVAGTGGLVFFAQSAGDKAQPVAAPVPGAVDHSLHRDDIPMPATGAASTPEPNPVPEPIAKTAPAPFESSREVGSPPVAAAGIEEARSAEPNGAVRAAPADTPAATTAPVTQQAVTKRVKKPQRRSVRRRSIRDR